MSKLVKPKFEYLERISDQGIEFLHDKISERQNDKKRIKDQNRKGAKRRAKQLGITSVENPEFRIQKKLADRIIQEVQRRKLRHIDVESISLTPRTKITAILNLNLTNTTIDLLINILSSLGINSDVYLDNLNV